MKFKTLLFIASTATAFAGTPYVAPASAPAPALCEWFVGASFGQLNDVGTNIDAYRDETEIFDPGSLDFNMYTLHVGRSLTNTNGWDIAAYLEVGWLDGEMEFKESFYDEEFQEWYGDKFGVDVDIIPVTANLKVEHTIYGPVSAYLTGGLGYAWTKISAYGDSERDGGFYAQASAGLIYNITESFELFAGARWLYLSDLDMGDTDVELDDSWAWEIGARYNF